MTLLVRPSVGSRFDHRSDLGSTKKLVTNPFSGSFTIWIYKTMEKTQKKKKKNLNENLGKKKNIIKPLTKPKPNANRKAQYMINLILD